MKTTSFAVVALLCSLATSQDRAPDPEFVTRTLARLGDRKAETADAAMVTLIRGGPQSVPLLQAVLAKAKEGPARVRAERALAICSVDAPVVDGVKIGLRADKETVADGGSVQLTATLCNVSDAPVAVYLGMSYSGNVLENGLALHRVDEAGEGEQARLGPVGFCGTGAQPVVVVLAPWSSQTFTAPATLRLTPPPAEEKGVVAIEGPHLRLGWFTYLPVAADAKSVRLRVQHEVDPKTAFGMVEPKAKPDWAGTLRSNDVTLDVRAPAHER